MKVLNLDKLTAHTGRALRIDNVDYPIQAMGVDDFIDTTNRVKELEQAESLDVMVQLQFMLDVICKLVPTVPREKLGKYNLETVSAIAEFVRGADVEGYEEAVEAEAGK